MKGGIKNQPDETQDTANVDPEEMSTNQEGIVVPWFADKYAAGADWRGLAWWIHDHLRYIDLQFFPKLAAFNISWHERPNRKIYSYIEPAGLLTVPDDPNIPWGPETYCGFPLFKRPESG